MDKSLFFIYFSREHAFLFRIQSLEICVHVCMLISIFAVYSTCSNTLLTSYFTYTGTSFLKVGWGGGRLAHPKNLDKQKKNIDAINFNYFYAPEKVGGRGGTNHH